MSLYYHLVPLTLLACILVLQPSLVECRPRTQRVIVHGHEWTVPDEPGWKEVLQEAEVIRQRFLSNCATSRDCRLAVERLQQFFMKHPVSAKHYASREHSASDNDLQSIFKWG